MRRGAKKRGVQNYHLASFSSLSTVWIKIVPLSQRADSEWQQPSGTEVQTETLSLSTFQTHTRSQQQACTTQVEDSNNVTVLTTD